MQGGPRAISTQDLQVQPQEFSVIHAEEYSVSTHSLGLCILTVFKQRRY